MIIITVKQFVLIGEKKEKSTRRRLDNPMSGAEATTVEDAVVAIGEEVATVVAAVVLTTTVVVVDTVRTEIMVIRRGTIASQQGTKVAEVDTITTTTATGVVEQATAAATVGAQEKGGAEVSSSGYFYPYITLTSGQ